MRSTRRALLLTAALMATTAAAAPGFRADGDPRHPSEAAPGTEAAPDPYAVLRRRWLDICLGIGYRNSFAVHWPSGRW
ncbi:hypothetical protein [Streptomyces sp. NPDC050287]|uniref:hypothetical protein n=1 Tax=Streptomyces sp. NPDC050287 TaxID=3365608 RepID=UPI0037A1DF6D